MKKMIWQVEWQNIEFSTLGVNLRFFSRASAEFYSAFYAKLFDKYSGYESLPSSWRDKKFETAKRVSEFLTEETKVLSVGCGLGYVEKSLIELEPKCNIDAYDFSTTSVKWLREIEGVRVMSELEKDIKYDFAYCTQLIYALSDKEIANLAVFLKTVLAEGAMFLTVDTSADQFENGDTTAVKFCFKQLLKNLILPAYYFFFKRNQAQFWGWKRSNTEIVKIFIRNGFIVKETFSAVGQSFIVFRS